MLRSSLDPATELMRKSLSPLICSAPSRSSLSRTTTHKRRLEVQLAKAHPSVLSLSSPATDKSICERRAISRAAQPAVGSMSFFPIALLEVSLIGPNECGSRDHKNRKADSSPSAVPKKTSGQGCRTMDGGIASGSPPRSTSQNSSPSSASASDSKKPALLPSWPVLKSSALSSSASATLERVAFVGVAGCRIHCNVVVSDSISRKETLVCRTPPPIGQPCVSIVHAM
mmetsp:Transcript_29835/g.87057  ORF Transcript_29835/g.87057 Transcript_29835/m.87057 type:complete len:228 (+) Transcript_29835:1417-2100(+)